MSLQSWDYKFLNRPLQTSEQDRILADGQKEEGRVVELIVTLCHDGKFDRATRAAEFVRRLESSGFPFKT